MSDGIEERLSIAVRYGARYSDEYQVEIVRTPATGKEYRRLLNPFPTRRFSFAYDIRATTLYNTLANLYHKVFGTYGWFRVKCLDDYTSNAGTLPPTKDDQILQYVSAGVYQLVKVYGMIGSAVPVVGRPYRIIKKPVAGTLLIAKNGVLVSSGVTLDSTTGRVTISPAPAYPADVITGGFEFDIPARFDSTLDVTHDRVDYRDVAALTLVEDIDA